MTVTDDLAAMLNACHLAPLDWQAKLVAADKAEEDGLTSCAWWLRWMAAHPQSEYLLSRRQMHDLAVPTGSRVYGTPRPDSDWDWVVPILPGYERHLRYVKSAADPNSSGGSGGTAEPYEGGGPNRLAGAYRFGPINMIHVATEPQLRVWTVGTSELAVERVVHGPRTREQAVAKFTELSRKYL